MGTVRVLTWLAFLGAVQARKVNSYWQHYRITLTGE